MKKNWLDDSFLNLPSHIINAGTLIPPSYADPLLPFNPPLLPLAFNNSGTTTAPIGSMSKTGPLSLKKSIRVFDESFSSFMLSMILPICLSRILIFAA